MQSIVNWKQYGTIVCLKKKTIWVHCAPAYFHFHVTFCAGWTPCTIIFYIQIYSRNYILENSKMYPVHPTTSWIKSIFGNICNFFLLVDLYPMNKFISILITILILFFCYFCISLITFFRVCCRQYNLVQ